MIEKILERLERYKKLRSDNTPYGIGVLNGYAEAIEIVKEVAKDGGWIPCSERLPKESELVLIYAESTARGGSIRCVAELHNGFWFAQIASDTLGLSGIGQFNIIAWQPLPAPYQKGE